MSNSFLEGGVLQEIKVQNEFALGVPMPIESFGATSGVAKVLGGEVSQPKFRSSGYSDVDTHAGVRC